MRRRSVQVLGLIGAVLLAASCKPKPQIKATVTVDFNPAEIEDNSLTNVTYHWKLDPGFKPIPKDLHVYVHFLDRSNKILFQEDHSPELPTSQWREGYDVNYTRLFLIPAVVRTDTDEESMPIKLVLGLHDPADPQGPNYRVLEKDLRLKYNPKGPEKIQYTEGWNPEESNPQMTLKWRWTGSQAVAVVRNPKKNAILYVRGLVNKDVLSDQKVRLEIANNLIEEFAPKEAEFAKYYQIPADQLGSEDLIQIRISTDKTFVPAKLVPGSTDQRELGVQIFTIFFK